MKHRFRWPIILFSLLEAAALIYLGIGYRIYEQLAAVAHGGGASAGNTPAQFSGENRDLSAYFMPDYESVTIQSRQPGLNIAAWHIPAAQPDAPAVILIHGSGGCKCDASVLLAAGMLHRHGFTVFPIDLRDMGMSDVEDGLHSAGTKEYLDALGVFDWLVNVKGIPPEKIGMWGNSFGAITSLDAFAAEPKLAAVFADSSFSDMQTALNEELARNNYPTWLAPAGLLMARIVSGDDLMSRSPLDAMRKHAGRPIFLTHGELDQRIDVHHAYDLLALGKQNDADIRAWIVPDAPHVRAIWLHSAEYEQKLVDFFEKALKK